MKKYILYLSVIFFFIFLIILPVVIKKVLVKKSPEITGREISISDIDLNLFTGSVEISGFSIYEPDKKSIFFLFEKLEINISMLRLLIGKLHIEKIYLKKPDIKIIYTKNRFNFSDIIEKFSKDDDDPEKEPNLKIALTNVKIDSGFINFHDGNHNSNIELSGIDFFLPFFYGTGEQFKIELKSVINKHSSIATSSSLIIDSGSYEGNIKISDFSCELIKPYITDFLNISDISGKINSILKLKGNLKTKSLIISAQNRITDFSVELVSETATAVSFSELGVDINEINLSEKIIDISSIRLRQPSIFFGISRDNHTYSKILKERNLQSSSEKINNDTSSIQSDTGIFQFALSEFSVEDGKFIFENRIMKKPAAHAIDNISFKASNITNISKISNNLKINRETSNIQFNSSFSLNNIGLLFLDFNYNPSNDEYSGNLNVDSLTLNVFQSYITEYTNISVNSGMFFLKSKISGSLKKNTAVLSGTQMISDLSLSETIKKKEFLSIKKLSLTLSSFDFFNKNIDISSIQINSPKLNFEYYENGTNFSGLIKNEDNNYSEPYKSKSRDISEEKPIKLVLKKFDIKNGSVIISDNTLSPAFIAKIEKTEFNINDIFFPSTNKNSELLISALINRNGKLKINSLFKTDFSNFNSDILLEELSLTEFTPYSLKSIAYPIKTGKLKIQSKISITGNKLMSENIFNFLNFDIGEKDSRFEGAGLPIKLALAILRDNKKNIKLDIPVEGNLDDPEFKLSRVIWYAVKNILVKAVSSPFNMLAKLAGTSEDELKEIKFNYLQVNPEENQIKQMEKIKKILDERENLVIEFLQFTDVEEEKNRLALNLCKEKYYRYKMNYTDTGILNESDKTNIAEIQENDTDILQFLITGILSKPEAESAQVLQTKSFLRLCIDYIGTNELDKKFRMLSDSRIESFKKYFLEPDRKYEKRVFIRNADSDEISLENKYLHFKIQLGGENNK
ncbi:DUF748 domain-containing protein [Candidatus Dependentiae bacterium]|nr:DUF748 domain-containing protein [Candidatus Dependentiae bacterium]